MNLEHRSLDDPPSFVRTMLRELSLRRTRRSQFDQLFCRSVYSSRCGPVSDKNAIVLLRRNARMFQTTFVVEKRDDAALAVLRGVQCSTGLESAEVARIIETMAKHADNIERKLVGTDEF